jgi:alcohol dehydrogenase, propanol-preferring
MRAAVVRSPGPITSAPVSVETRPDLAPGPGELVLEVRACAACRTDLQIAEGDLAPRRLPIVPGHQVAGVVAAVGAGVDGWCAGDRAGAAWLGWACGTCERCREGRENLCPGARFTGWDRDGGFAEQIALDARFALHLPDGFEDLAVAPLLCGGIIGYRALSVSGIESGGRLGLFGFGASALLALQVAVHRRCEVFVATRSPREQARARAFGAAWAGGYDETMPTDLDAAVTFAPSGDVVIAALRAIRPGGTVAINAIHLDRVPEFSYDLLWRERSLRSVANFTRRDANEFLALAAEIPIRTISEPHPLDNANLVLQRIASGAVEGAAVIVP